VRCVSVLCVWCVVYGVWCVYGVVWCAWCRWCVVLAVLLRVLCVSCVCLCVCVCCVLCAVCCVLCAVCVCCMAQYLELVINLFPVCRRAIFNLPSMKPHIGSRIPASGLHGSRRACNTHDTVYPVHHDLFILHGSRPPIPSKFPQIYCPCRNQLDNKNEGIKESVDHRSDFGISELNTRHTSFALDSS